ncbi:MAG TPA: hypothetical protein VFH80_23145 [Solirubrobacteraceae bacterium]|nr:hypothetical protein [Solirubrobacteraceae bacterium]
MTGRDRFLAALAGEGLAFAPIVWEGLPALIHQEQADWWRDPTVGQRMIADAAALAGADAMFVFAAAEVVRSAVAEGARGDAALDALASLKDARHGPELVQALRATARHAVIAAVPSPGTLQRELGSEDSDAAEDAFTDFVTRFLEAGADAVAVTSTESLELNGAMDRAVRLVELFGRGLVAVLSGEDGDTKAWDEQGEPLGVITSEGDWPDRASGVVITPGDVSARWDAAQLRAVGKARPSGISSP